MDSGKQSLPTEECTAALFPGLRPVPGKSSVQGAFSGGCFMHQSSANVPQDETESQIQSPVTQEPHKSWQQPTLRRLHCGTMLEDHLPYNLLCNYCRGDLNPSGTRNALLPVEPKPFCCKDAVRIISQACLNGHAPSIINSED